MIITNIGRQRIFESVFRNTNTPTGFYLALVTGANIPTVHTTYMSELTQIAAGNGYTSGGQAVARSGSGFDTATEDDTNALALVLLIDFSWTASGGAIPASGANARYAVLTDNNATVANRIVYAAWDLVSPEWAVSGGTISVTDFAIRLRNNTNWTAKGLYSLLDWFFRGATMPTYFYVALVTDATAPTVSTNTMSQLTEIAAGNGYTSGGYQLSRNSTDFPTIDETADVIEIIFKSVTWTASGGAIPSSGDNGVYAVLTNDNGTVGSRIIIAYWTQADEWAASSGQQISINELQLNGGIPS